MIPRSLTLFYFLKLIWLFKVHLKKMLYSVVNFYLKEVGKQCLSTTSLPSAFSFILLIMKYFNQLHLFPVSKNAIISPLAALVIFLVYLNLHVYIIFCCKKVCFFPFMANMWWLNHNSIYVFSTVLDCESLQYPLLTEKFPSIVVPTTADSQCL